MRSFRPSRRAWSPSSAAAGCDCEQRPESCESACELRLAPDRPESCALAASAEAPAPHAAVYSGLHASDSDGSRLGGRSSDGVRSSSPSREGEASAVELRPRDCASAACCGHWPLGDERHARHSYCRLADSLAHPLAARLAAIATPTPTPTSGGASSCWSPETGSETCERLMPPVEPVAEPLEARRERLRGSESKRVPARESAASVSI